MRERERREREGEGRERERESNPVIFSVCSDLFHRLGEKKTDSRRLLPLNYPRKSKSFTNDTFRIVAHLHISMLRPTGSEM